MTKQIIAVVGGTALKGAALQRPCSKAADSPSVF